MLDLLPENLDAIASISLVAMSFVGSFIPGARGIGGGSFVATLQGDILHSLQTCEGTNSWPCASLRAVRSNPAEINSKPLSIR